MAQTDRVLKIMRILERSNQFQVIGEATNGGEAIKEVILKSPDNFTLPIAIRSYVGGVIGRPVFNLQMAASLLRPNFFGSGR